MADQDTNQRKVDEKEAEVRKGFWPKMRGAVSRVPFSEDAVAAYYCATDKQTPLTVKGTLLGALAYFILPTDLIPDFLVGLGYVDDASVMMLALSSVRGAMLPAHKEKAKKALGRTPIGDEEGELEAGHQSDIST